MLLKFNQKKKKKVPYIVSNNEQLLYRFIIYYSSKSISRLVFLNENDRVKRKKNVIKMWGNREKKTGKKKGKMKKQKQI